MGLKIEANIHSNIKADNVTIKSRFKNKRSLAGFLFMLPGFLFIFVYMIFPLFKSLYLSFTEYNFAFDDSPRFNGIQNFKHMLSDSYFIAAFKNTFVFTAFFLPSILIISLSVALLLNKALKGTGFFRTSVFLPVVIPISLTGIIFQWILNQNFGLVNYFLRDVLGASFLAKDWLTDEFWAMISIVSVSLWHFLGIEIILFLGGLQSISNQLYEAAKVDGANAWKALVHITLPNLKETYVITGIWALIASVKVFEQPFVMTKGGPGTSTLVLYQYVWQNAFQLFDMGYASAIAYVMGAIILVGSLINIKLNQSKG